ncbi:MAG TPA: PaaI family thioesterase [Solirubrobacterales bacterium]|nr:PaaI family thioesterase [Solirubrobacterales bacterium]
MSSAPAAVGVEDSRDAVGSAARHAELAPAATRRRELVWQDPLDSLARLAGLTGIEQMQAIMDSDVPPPPIAVLMRMAPVELAEGRVAFRGEPSEEHYNPIGTVHGGYAATLLDTVLGCAVQTTLAPGEAYTTQSLEAKMVRPITRETGPVVGTGEVAHRGRRQATATAEIRAEASGKLLAHGTSTLMILGSR